MLRTLIFPALGALMFASCETAASNPPAPGGGKMCGGIAAIQCGSGEYCQIEEGKCLTIADVAGVCRPRPEMCTMIYAPVCGCDGQTYSSACVAASHGVSVAARGKCKP